MGSTHVSVNSLSEVFNKHIIGEFLHFGGTVHFLSTSYRLILYVLAAVEPE